jgi:hypothetical protein
MEEGRGIHVKYLPGSFVPRANKANDYLLDRTAQKEGLAYSGVEGIAMQDASIQESMGPIVDRSRENLVSTDNGIIMTRRVLLRAIKANRAGQPVPGLAPSAQRVRSCAIELPKGERFVQGARHGLFRELETDPISV